MSTPSPDLGWTRAVARLRAISPQTAELAERGVLRAITVDGERVVSPHAACVAELQGTPVEQEIYR